MGFSPEVWFEDGLGEGRSLGQVEQSRDVAGGWGTSSRLSGTRRRESLTQAPRLLA